MKGQIGLLLLTLTLLPVGAAEGQTQVEGGIEAMVAAVEAVNTSDVAGVSDAPGTDQVAIIASKDKSAAMIAVKKRCGSNLVVGTVTTPIDKGDDSTEFLTFSGPPDDFELGLSWKWRGWNKDKLDISSFDFDTLHTERERICNRNGVPEGKPCTRPELEAVLAGKSATVRNRELRSFDSFVLKKVALKDLAFTATAGRTERKYFSLAGEEESDDDLTYSFALSGGRIYANWLWRVEAAAKRKFKEQDKGQLCAPVEGSESLESCKTLPVGKALPIDVFPLSFELRKLMGNGWAISPKISYDFKNEVFAGSLPVYFLANEDRLLSGGIRLDWEEGKEAVVSVFVSSPFGID
ncbi:MAG: hypothetical protein KDD47_16745 [Acidobacteria bacterium]|nr:hypothetical protein [Acidobacteriota bacterium]